ncbi:MAG: putative Ig domain-containing protein, partial [Bryobacteraceae bacterium]
MTRRAGCEIAAALFLLVVLAPTVGAQITVLSGASYQPVVAPGSFASLFGNGLAPSIAVGSPGSNGSYPKQLNGLTVTVGGVAADLVMVSPSQINFVVPLSVPYGTASVSVGDGLETIAAGSVSISPTAPAIFTTDASGSGFGAVLDAVDYSPPPFTLSTSEGGGHVTTYAAVFGTGFRYAGGTSPSDSPGDVSRHVTAVVTDPQGHSWQLPVLYAGPAPGYEGLDQINIQFVDGINTEADLTLTIYADAVPSNPVYLSLRSKTLLALSAVAPTSGSPGSSITLSAAGLLDTTRFMVSTRQYAVFTLSDGTQVRSEIGNVTGSAGEVLVPAAPGSTASSYYNGPVKLCVFVDLQTACLPFAIAAPPQTGQPVGALLLAATRTAISNAINSLPPDTDPALKALITSGTQARLVTLEKQIADAVNGHPDTVQTSDLNGMPITVAMDLAMIQRLEGLLAANPYAAVSLDSARFQAAAAPASSQSCQLSQEGYLYSRKQAFDAGQAGVDLFSNKIRNVANNITQGCFNALAKVGASALNGVCLTLGNTVSFVESSVDDIFALGDYGVVLVQLLQEWNDPIFLQSIQAAPSQASLSYASPTSSFDIVGTLASKSGGVLLGDVVSKFVSDEITSKIVDDGRALAALNPIPFCGIGGCQGYYDFLNTVADYFQNRIVSKLNGLIAGYNLSPSRTDTAWLGAFSLTDSSTLPSVSVSLACVDGDRSSVTLMASPVDTAGTVTFTADPNKLLVLDPSSPPRTSFTFSVNNATPVLSTDKSSYRIQDTVQVKGTNFPAGMHLSLSLQGIRTTSTLVPNLAVAADGTIRQPISLTSAAPGIYSLVASSINGQTVASSGTFTIVASPIAHFTMNASGNSASDGGLLTVSVLPNASVNVYFDATVSSAPTGASIAKWTWQSNGGNLNCSSATCTLPFSTPSNTITLTITDSNGQVAQTTAQLNLSTVQPSGDFALTMDKNALSVIQGQNAALNVGVQSSGGFQSRVRFSTGGLPPGVTVSWNPAAVTPSGNGSFSSSLTISTSNSTPIGPYTVTLQGTADGFVQKSTTVSLTIGAALPGPTAHFKITALGQTAQDGQTLTLQPTSTAPVQVTLDGSASVSPGGSIATWLWASSGVPLACTTSTCTAYFATATNAVTLTITDATGKSSTAAAQVNVVPPGGPSAHFTMSAQGKSASDAGVLNCTTPANGTVPVSFASSTTQGTASLSTYAWKSNGVGLSCVGSACGSAFGVGSYVISLAVADSNGLTSTATGQFSVTVQQAPATIAVSPLSFAPAFTVGDPVGTLGFTITNTATGTLTGTITASTNTGGNWLTIGNLTSNSSTWSAPQTLAVTANPAGLTAGNYTGSLIVTAPGATNSPFTIPVTMSIYTAVKITTAALPDANAGASYSFQLQASGGSGSAYTWALGDGPLPGGLTLSQSGLISGTVAATSSVITTSLGLSVQDSAGHFATTHVPITWRPGLAISDLYIPSQPVVGSPNPGFTVQATGGTPPYTWSATSLPPGLTLAS